MNKAIFTLLCFFTMAPAAVAGDQALNAVCEDMLSAAEAYADCMSGREACTQQEVLSFKALMEGSLQSMGILLRAGSAARNTLTAPEAQALRKRSRDATAQLAALPALDAGCNLSVFLMTYSVRLLEWGVWVVLGAPGDTSVDGALLRSLYLLFVWFGLLAVFIGSVSGLLSIVLAPACLLL